MMKEFHRVAPLGSNTNNKEVAINSLLLRNYNDGRTGGWNNYCCYKGQGKGTYVADALVIKEMGGFSPEKESPGKEEVKEIE